MDKYVEWCKLPESERYIDDTFMYDIWRAEWNHLGMTREMQEYNAFYKKHEDLVKSLPVKLLEESRKFSIADLGYSVERKDWLGNDLVDIRPLSIPNITHGVVCLVVGYKNDEFVGYRFRSSALSWPEFQKAIKSVERAIAKQHSSEELVVDLTQSSSSSSSVEEIEIDRQHSAQEALLCVVCTENRADTRVEPCGHSTVCKSCSLKLESTPNKDLCIYCRTPISAVWEN